LAAYKSVFSVYNFDSQFLIMHPY